MPALSIAPAEVRETIQKYLIGDGFPIVFDLQRSHGSWIVDARDGGEYLDFYTFFASLPLGFHHPALERPENRERLLDAVLHKPANSDAHTRELARFVGVFAEKALPEGFRHLFFIDGGTLAVENALKTAFDWKVRRNLAAGRGEKGSRVIHFRQAFHGRSGYTLSLTNTLPIKTDYFPKFDWPRIHNPKLRFPVDAAETARVAAEEERALREMDAAFRAYENDVAAIIIEPIQGEGGDNHFRGEFLRRLREVADREEALLIYDEVQTGFGMTGKMWAFEHFDAPPDLLCFGKKSQVCGIMAGPKVDEVSENVFTVSSRINSTWGGSLADMARCEIILEAMEAEDLIGNAARVGARLLAGLEALQERHPGRLENARGRGLFLAVDLPDKNARDELLKRCRENRLLVLPCGERTVRLRPPLTIRAEEADEGIARLERSLD